MDLDSAVTPGQNQTPIWLIFFLSVTSVARRRQCSCESLTASESEARMLTTVASHPMCVGGTWADLLYSDIPLYV